MDFARALKIESVGGHAVFHEFALAQSKAKLNSLFLFFEGENDPSFYINHAQIFLQEKEYFEFICWGRNEVLKVQELVARDGRAAGRALFFVDKDHTDFLDEPEKLPVSVFQTAVYSFENYIPESNVFRRFWVERLHLSVTDSRYGYYLNLFNLCHVEFVKRCRLLMAVVLIGRGIWGWPKAKLNLNNVNLDRVLRVDVATHKVRWREGAAVHFLASSDMNIAHPNLSVALVRRVARMLKGKPPKTYMRGKYELWFFVKFLQSISHALSCRSESRRTGLRRATPAEMLTVHNCVESLAPLSVQPSELRDYLKEMLGNNG